MTEETRPTLTTIELEPIDPTRLRSTAGSDVWETVKGKRNRIEIGEPYCLQEEKPSEGGMLTSNDLLRFPRNHHAFFRLNLSLTLLPDRQSRFRSVDFFLDFRQTAINRQFPLVLRLKPAEHSSQKVVVDEKQGNRKVSLSDPYFKVIGSELGTSHVRREEIEQIMVDMESFGATTQQAGWRFRLTDSQEIPINPTGLEALIVLPRDTRGKVQFIIAAEIESLSKLGQWLTWAFKRANESAIQSFYEFPPIGK